MNETGLSTPCRPSCFSDELAPPPRPVALASGVALAEAESEEVEVDEGRTEGKRRTAATEAPWGALYWLEAVQLTCAALEEEVNVREDLEIKGELRRRGRGRGRGR